jgi:hypothetical protein
VASITGHRLSESAQQSRGGASSGHDPRIGGGPRGFVAAHGEKVITPCRRAQAPAISTLRPDLTLHVTE